MSILARARAALLVFLLTYLASLAVPLLTSNDGLQEAGFLLGLLSTIGVVLASLIAAATQLWLLLRRGLGKKSVRG